ncbi:hypothetical protein COB57_06200 [Candidatus Peregrinibacteria bacterium]|nr:MAG: hypothetical protein COB57_06200 [Candidatus Peregrinibacteria bacterium]
MKNNSNTPLALGSPLDCDQEKGDFSLLPYYFNALLLESAGLDAEEVSPPEEVNSNITFDEFDEMVEAAVLKDVMNLVSKDGLVLKELSEDMQANPAIVLEAFRHDPRSLRFASPGLSNDVSFLQELIKDVENDALNIESRVLSFFTQGALQNNRLIILEFAKSDILEEELTEAIGNLSNDLKNDKGFAFQLFSMKKDRGDLLRLFDQSIKKDREVLKAALVSSSHAMEYISMSWVLRLLGITHQHLEDMGQRFDGYARDWKTVSLYGSSHPYYCMANDSLNDVRFWRAVLSNISDQQHDSVLVFLPKSLDYLKLIE